MAITVHLTPAEMAEAEAEAAVLAQRRQEAMDAQWRELAERATSSDEERRTFEAQRAELGNISTRKARRLRGGMGLTSIPTASGPISRRKCNRSAGSVLPDSVAAAYGCGSTICPQPR
jgi:hypothetical protein